MKWLMTVGTRTHSWLATSSHDHRSWPAPRTRSRPAGPRRSRARCTSPSVPGQAWVIPVKTDAMRMPVEGRLRVRGTTNAGDTWQPSRGSTGMRSAR